MKGFTVGHIVRRGWMVLVAVLVVTITAFAISRLHGLFGSHDTTSAN
ncbi:MmpS family transport accessory protein, partial [Mycobacterium sp.]